MGGSVVAERLPPKGGGRGRRGLWPAASRPREHRHCTHLQVKLRRFADLPVELRKGVRGNALAGDVSSQQIASTLREMLKRIGTAAIKQWDGLTRDRSLFVAYEGCLRVGSQLLSLLEGDIDPRMNALAAPMSNVLEGDMSTAEGLAALKKAVSALD